MTRRTALICALSGTGWLLTCQGMSIAWYFDAHNFNIAPTNPNVAFAARWRWDLRTSARDRDENDPKTSSGVGPPQSPGSPGFAGYRSILSQVTHAEGFADAAGRLGPLAVGGPLAGDTSVFGYAFALPDPPGFSLGSAFSDTWFDANAGIMRNGRIQWVPQWSAKVGRSTGSARETRGRIRDPLNFSVFDATHTNLLADLSMVKIDATVFDNGGADGSMEWAGGRLSVDARNADLTVQVGNAFTSINGAMSLQIRNGLVTSSSDSGIYDNLLPVVGSGGVFTANVGTIDMTFDLSPLSATPNVDVEINTQGEAFEAVPEPATMAAMCCGLVLLSRRRTRHRRH